MYWLLGLELAQSGHLWTFEPNDTWAAIARENLATVSAHFTAVTGTFEDNVDDALSDNRIDVAFIDAVHTSEFVRPQYRVRLRTALARRNRGARRHQFLRGHGDMLA